MEERLDKNPLVLLELVERLGNLMRTELRKTGADEALQPVHLQALTYISKANRYSNTPQALADYLVRKGVPFRDAHEIVARAVRAAEASGKDLAGLGIEELRGFSAFIGEDVRPILTPEGSVASRKHIGGTAPEAVRAAIARARKRL